MPVVRLEPQTPSSSSSSSSLFNSSSSSSFSSLLSSIFGPRGQRLHIGSSSSPRVITSSSSRLLSSLSVSDPFLSLVVAGMKRQTDVFKDGGVSAGLLTLRLAAAWRAAGSSAALADEAAEIVLKTMEGLDSFVMDPKRLEDLTLIARSILTSKASFFNAPDERVDEAARLVVRAFVSALDSRATNKLGTILFAEARGCKWEESRLEEGIAFLKPIDYRAPSSSGPWIVAIFDVSLSGDSDEFVGADDATSRDERDAGLDRFVDVDVFVAKANEFVDELIDRHGVSVILCQKVIHPHLKSHVTDRGAVFLERLSASTTDSILLSTGAKRISSLHSPDVGDRLGRLSGIDEHRLPDGKSYLFLRGAISVAQTIVVGAPTEETYLDTRRSFEACVSCLRRTLGDAESRKFVSGGGCYWTGVAAALAAKEDSLVADWSTVDSTPKSAARRCLGAVVEAFRGVAASLANGGVESVAVEGHHWMINGDVDEGAKVSCGCGKKIGEWVGEEIVGVAESQIVGVAEPLPRPSIVDSLDKMISAARMAFELAALMVNTNEIISAG